MAFDAEYAGLRKSYRKGVVCALDKIRQGSIDEQDLDKLNNFCMVALMLMTKVNMATWRSAENMADIGGYLCEIAEQEDKNEMVTSPNNSGILANPDRME